MAAPLQQRAVNPIVITLAILLVAGCGGGDGAPKGNRSPIVSSMQFSTSEDATLIGQIDASDPDGDALTFSRASEPSRGTLTAFSSSGAFTYHPTENISGPDSFGVQVSDSKGSSIVATVTIQVAPVSDPVLAKDDILHVELAGVTGLNVHANDSNPDGDQLIVAIEEPAPVGIATVNTDGSISLSGLPNAFRGVTRFKYRITSPNGSVATAAAAVFVGIEPFRLSFVADTTGTGTHEIFISNLAAAPLRATSATEGDMRLKAFEQSAKGETIVYRRQDAAVPTPAAELWFLRNGNATRITLPAGFGVTPNSNSFDQFAVSQDGESIAVVAREIAGFREALFLFDADGSLPPREVSPPSTIGVSNLRFSPDSQHIYFVASLTAFPFSEALFRAAVESPSAAVQLSAPPAIGSDRRIVTYAGMPDQSKVIYHVTSDVEEGIYYVNPAAPATEIRLSQALGMGDLIITTTMNGSTIGRSENSRIAFAVQQSNFQTKSYVAEVSTTPNPRLLVDNYSSPTMLRGDNAAVLYTDGINSFEAPIDSTAPPTLVGEGDTPYFDSTDNTIFMLQTRYLPDGQDLYFTGGVSFRETFGTTLAAGTPGLALQIFSFRLIDRGVMIIGEGPPPHYVFSNGAANRARVALINARVPDKLIYLSDLDTPFVFASGRVQVLGVP